MSSENPTGRRGRLSRSGRFLPLVKPATIAPPTGELEEEDDYAEVSIDRDPIVEETPVPDRAPGAGGADEVSDDDDDALTPPR